MCPFTVDRGYYKGPQRVNIHRINNGGVPSPTWHIYKAAPILKVQGSLLKRSGEILRARAPRQGIYWEIMSSLCERDTTPLKSKQCGCLNMICKMITQVDVPTCQCR